MKKNLASLFIAAIVAITCDGPLGPESQHTHHGSVSVAFIAEAVAKSTYKITISGSGMKTIGPLEYAGGQTIELYVPVGTSRQFRFERYDSNSVLIDTGTTLLDIGAGMNAVSARLISAIPTYTITYDGNNSTGGMAPPAQTKTKGVALTLALNSGNLVKSNFTFAGWNTAADGSGTGYAEAVSYTIDTVTTLYAKWTPLPTYTVTYVGNGSTGTVPPPQTKTKGVAITLASDSSRLEKSGYVFDGWNTVADGNGTGYGAGAGYFADSSITLYAKWSLPPMYMVAYNGNGNSGGIVPSLQSKVHGVTLTLASNSGNLEKSNYLFTGWNTAPGGNGNRYAEGGSYTADAAMTLYAEWTILATYLVTYNGNGNTGGNAPPLQSKVRGIALTLASNTGSLTKAGYTFSGWNTTADSSGTSYAEGANYTTDTAVTLYAKWSELPMYTITYNGNGNSGGILPPEQSKTKGIALTLASNAGNLAKAGFTFAGWNTAADGSGTSYTEGANYTADAAVTLFAKWSELPMYLVTYDGNGNSGGDVPPSQKKTKGIALTLASNSGILTKTNVTFAGWNTAADGNGTNYAEGGNYTADTAITLFAKWTDLPIYTVTYNGNGFDGGTVPSPQTKTQGVALSLAYNTGLLAKSGYIFAGWNTAADGSGTYYTPGGNYTIDAGVTLYVNWEATFTVTYNGNNNTGGNIPSPQTKLQRVALTLATNNGNLRKAGFTFSGWNTGADGNGTSYDEGGAYAVDSTLVLYAEWAVAQTYIVTYDGNNNSNGTAPASQDKTQGILLTLSTNSGYLTKTGYTFSGWNTAADGYGTDYAEGGSYTIDAAMTLYAKWTVLPKYSVTYDGNNNSGGTAPPQQDKIRGITLTLASNSGSLARSGYTFIGWNTASNGSGIDYTEGGSYTVDAPITLYAKWRTTGPQCNLPILPDPSGLTVVNTKLPDPFKFYNGTVMTRKDEWPCRRAEILSMAEKYLYGPMPPDPDEITGTVSGSTITANVRVGSNTKAFTFGASGTGEVLCLETSSAGIVPSSCRRHSIGNHIPAIQELYGMSVCNSIAMAWAAKIICAVIDQNPAAGINPDKIMVTGCSGGAKVVLAVGAFCEGIDLTVIVESGGGGASSLRMAEWFRHGDGDTIWRCSDGKPQGIDNLEDAGIAGPWVDKSVCNWLVSAPSKVNNLPFDQHLVLACISPRAVCHVTNHNGLNEWCHLGGTCEALSAWAAEPVWNALGVPANFGFLMYSEATAPGHCSSPSSATTLAQKFFDRVFSGNTAAATDVMTILPADVQLPVSVWSTMWVDWNMSTTLD